MAGFFRRLDEEVFPAPAAAAFPAPEGKCSAAKSAGSGKNLKKK